MELIKSKGLAIFFIVVLALTVVSSFSTKKYDNDSKVSDSYISMNEKDIL